MADDRLAGGAVLIDSANTMILSGNISFISDGKSRSEIVIMNPDSGREERLVFSHGSTWMAVYHLIQVIRELFQTNELEVQIEISERPCPECGGAGMIEDTEGNWRDCRSCAP